MIKDMDTYVCVCTNIQVHVNTHTLVHIYINVCEWIENEKLIEDPYRVYRKQNAEYDTYITLMIDTITIIEL